MPSVHLRAVVFTITGKDPAKNPYCSIALLWLAKVIEVAGLTDADEIGLVMDEATAAYIETTAFIRLVAAAPCPVSVYTVAEQPATLTDGAMYRYLSTDYTQDYFMYCDIDILFMGPIHPVLDHAIPDTIHLHAEGYLTHEAFGATLPAEVTIEGKPGFNSGKFIITSRRLLEHLFTQVNQLVQGSTRRHWALDQPFFNHAILMIHPKFIDTYVFYFAVCDRLTKLGSPGTLLLDLNGETGDGGHHLAMMVQGAIMLGLKSLI